MPSSIRSVEVRCLRPPRRMLTRRGGEHSRIVRVMLARLLAQVETGIVPRRRIQRRNSGYPWVLGRVNLLSGCPHGPGTLFSNHSGKNDAGRLLTDRGLVMFGCVASSRGVLDRATPSAFLERPAELVMERGKATKLMVPVLFVVLVLATPAAAAPPITDTFGRPNGPIGVTDTGQTWLQTNGTWAIESNHARVTTRTSYGYATVQIASASAFVVEANIRLSSTFRRANAGLTVLWRNAANHIFCKIEVTSGRPTGLMSIGRKLNNVTASLLAFRAGTGFVNGQTYHVACSRSGNRLTMTVSGGTSRRRFRSGTR